MRFDQKEPIRLGELVSINKRSYNPRKNWGFINYLDTGNITENIIDEIKFLEPNIDKIPSRARRIVEENDIIFSTVRPNQRHYGLIEVPLENMLVSTGFAVLTPKESIVDSKYLYYYLTQDNIIKLLHSIAEQSTSAYPSIRPIDLQNLEIVLPCMNIQRQVANTLSCLDKKIELNNKINENLEQQAQAIFKNWFVDFEPFQDGKFVESELGMIPEGWNTGTFGDIAEVSSGKRPKLKEDIPTQKIKVPIVGASQVMGYTNEFLFKEKILITGRVGTHGIVQRFNTACWPSDNTLVIKSEFYEFAYQVMNSFNYSALNRGSTQPLITQTDIRNQIVVIPPIDVLEEFEDLIQTLMALRSKQISQNVVLAKLRDTLLPKLMSGEIEVPVE